MVSLSKHDIRRLLCVLNVLVSLLTATSAFAHKDRFESPSTVTIAFKTGERVTFTISEDAISAITVRVGMTDFAMPAKECAKLKDVRFETVSLLWDSRSPSAAKARYFYLQFDMGKETARAFGELPRVELMFRDRKFDESTVRKKIAEDTWQDSKL
jgi:hypothetical protein